MEKSVAPFARALVPYDGSEPAQVALGYGLELARGGTALAIVTVVDETTVMAQIESDGAGYDPTPLFEALDAGGRKLLEEALERCRAANVTAETEVIHDLPVDGILTAAHERACDLIVMGTHARSGLAHAILGSTTEGVLRSSDVPVLAVRATVPDRGHTFGTALVAVDDSDPSDAALAVAAKLAACGTKLIVCHAVDTMKLYENATTFGYDPTPMADELRAEARAALERSLAHAGLTVEPANIAIVEGEAVTAILETAQERGADLIVIGSHGRRGITRLILGSVAENVVRHAPTPVLVVRKP
jgi:nucleotide-binding universal stress UspA family protein